MSGMDKKDPYKLDALDASLNPYGRHLRHLAEHAGTIPAGATLAMAKPSFGGGLRRGYPMDPASLYGSLLPRVS